MAYVALSRCESMEDVKIAGKFDITQIKANPFGPNFDNEYSFFGLH